MFLQVLHKIKCINMYFSYAQWYVIKKKKATPDGNQGAWVLVLTLMLCVCNSFCAHKFIQYVKALTLYFLSMWLYLEIG